MRAFSAHFHNSNYSYCLFTDGKDSRINPFWEYSVLKSKTAENGSVLCEHTQHRGYPTFFGATQFMGRKTVMFFQVFFLSTVKLTSLIAREPSSFLVLSTFHIYEYFIYSQFLTLLLSKKTSHCFGYVFTENVLGMFATAVRSAANESTFYFFYLPTFPNSHSTRL